MRTHYQILGISNEATPREIKEAHRRMVRACHPDRFPDDPICHEQFEQVQAAYETLMDEQARRIYDWSIRPVLSVTQLFESAYGQQMKGQLLPKAPAAPRDGLDLFRQVTVPEEMLRDGGVVDIPHPTEESTLITMTCEPGYTWARFEGLGKSGLNGGQPGDLYIELVPTPNAQ